MPKKKKPESHQPETSTPSTLPASIREDYTGIKAKESQPTEVKTTASQTALSEPRFLQAKDFVSVYANHVFFAPTTVWDFRITFGEIIGAHDKSLLIENRVSVTMPVAIAKILALGIEENLRQYEKATGKSLELPGVVFAAGPGGVGTPPAAKESAEEK